MATKLFLIFNHEITDIQEKDAIEFLGVDAIEDLPQDLKAIWSDIPPDLQEIRGYLSPVMEWMECHAARGDYVLIQGDFGACYIMAGFALKKGLVPVYSTTRREAVEEHLQDGSIRLAHLVRHRMFRRYGD
jgi:hypothetical protein